MAGKNLIDDSKNAHTDLITALKEVEKKIDDTILRKYRLFVTVLLNIHETFTNGKEEFHDLVEALANRFGSHSSAVKFTIEALEYCEWEDTRSLTPFASAHYDLDDAVSLTLTVYKFYNRMDEEKFKEEKEFVKKNHLESYDVGDLDRCDFVLLLYREEVIRVGDVSKIEGDNLFFEDYRERFKYVPDDHVNFSSKTDLPIVDIVGHFTPVDDKCIAKFSKEKDQDLVYEYTSSPGYCLVISMTKDRDGNTNDVNRLEVLFKNTLKFAFKEYKDLTMSQINELMTKVRNANRRCLSCFVMFILAHGNTDKDGDAFFFTHDGKPYKVSTIKWRIENTESLYEKPKLLFLQSCRGGIDNTGVLKRDKSGNKKDDQQQTDTPFGSDFLTAYATIKDYVAYRDAVDGTPFIQTLCGVFTDYYKEHDVMTMMTIVTKRVANWTCPAKTSDGEFIDVMQISEFTSTLRKFLYFLDLQR